MVFWLTRLEIVLPNEPLLILLCIEIRVSQANLLLKLALCRGIIKKLPTFSQRKFGCKSICLKRILVVVEVIFSLELIPACFIDSMEDDAGEPLNTAANPIIELLRRSRIVIQLMDIVCCLSIVGAG